MSRSFQAFFWVVLMLGFALGPGCGKSDERPEGAPSGERTKEPVPETPKDSPSGPFAGFDFAAAKQAWQGAWVLEGDVVGSHVAWLVEGDRVRVFDGQTERELGFAVYSPCQVTTTHDGEDGSVTTYTNFTFVGDQLHAGLGSSGTVAAGPAGTSDSEKVIVCDGGKTYVLTGDRCVAWSELFDDWKDEPATCTLEGQGADRKFVVDGRSIGFLGEASLGTEQMRANVASKQPNFDAAKAALASAGAKL
jgi:hypothetical protein